MGGPPKPTQALVIDNGSLLSKVGFAGDAAPHSVFPTTKKSNNGRTQPLHNVEPIQRGIIQDWETMEQIWHFTFYNQLKIQPEGCSVLITEVPHNSNENLKQMAKILFDTFKVPALFIVNQAVLSLYASGRTTGCVLECGHGVTQIVPVFEGYALNSAIKTLDLGGKDLTQYLMKLLNERGYSFTKEEHQVVQRIKESTCYIAIDIEEEMNKMKNVKYELEDGNVIVIGNEKFQCPEVLFQPKLMGLEMDGIAESVVESINKCNETLHKKLYGNIVLSGGSTLFPGLEERLSKEVTQLVPESNLVKIIATPERKNSVWIGGSILAAYDPGIWVSKEEYEKCGVESLHPKRS